MENNENQNLEKSNEVVEQTTTQQQEEVIKQEVAKAIEENIQPPKPEPSDRHSQLDPYKDEKPYKDVDDKIIAQSIILPTSVYNTLDKFLDVINNTPDEKLDAEYTDAQKDAARVAGLGQRYTIKDNVYVDNLNRDINNYVNSIKFSDKTLGIKALNMGEPTKNMSPAQASLRFRSLLSIGEAIQVPLWHSGIWVTLKPPTQTDIVNLQIALSNNEIQLGRDTATLVYSNYAVVFNRIISDFILKHIDNHSLKIPDNEDIRDYILINDYYPLVLALTTSMYPKGINVIKGCVNNAVMGNDNAPMCDFVVNAILDPKKLLWVDRTVLDNVMLTHMSNRLEKSMSVDSVKDYQLRMKQLVDKDYELKTESGVAFKITYRLPTLKHYIVNGEKWVNNIIKRAEGLFSDSDTVDSKNDKVYELAIASALGIYNVFVKQIYVGDVPVTDEEAINEMLSSISTDDDAFEGFVKTVEEFITNSGIAIVATPSYTCPNCKKHQTEGKTGAFKEFIPFNIVEHFFVLCALRSEKTRNRNL